MAPETTGAEKRPPERPPDAPATKKRLTPKQRSTVKRTTALAIAIPVAGLVLPLLGSRAARVVQDRRQQLELKVALINDVEDAFTTTVVNARLFASKLVAAAAPAAAPAAASEIQPASASAYTALLNRWLTESSKVGAKIDSFYGGRPCGRPAGDETKLSGQEALRCEWYPMFRAVTDYLRLSTAVETFNRKEATDMLLEFFQRRDPAMAANQATWSNLADPASAGFFPAVSAVGDELLAQRDLLVDDIRTTHMSQFLEHFLPVP